MNITVSNVSKRLKKEQLLKETSFSLSSGAVLGINGPNGSGKTTLLRIVAGLTKPTEGFVEIEGKRLWRDVDFPPSIGLLIENPALLNSKTGFQNLKLLASIKRVASDKIIHETMKKLGLNPLSKKRFRNYSLGMKQRLGIAAAIMESPDLILLDEPTNALDLTGESLVAHLIKESSERGAIVIVASHDEAFLHRTSHAILDLGQEGTATCGARKGKER